MILFNGTHFITQSVDGNWGISEADAHQGYVYLRRCAKNFRTEEQAQRFIEKHNLNERYKPFWTAYKRDFKK